MRLLTQSTLLVIEDDPHFRESLMDAMALKGMEVRGASSGAEALKAIETSSPSVIIMDVQLPDRHGFDLCRQIKRSLRLKRVPIVFLSARFTEPGERAEGLMAGADAYLCKPVSVETLWSEIQYLLDREC